MRAAPHRFDQPYEFGKALRRVGGETRLPGRARPVLEQADPVAPERLEPDVAPELLPDPGHPALEGLEHRVVIILAPFPAERHLPAAVPEPPLERPAPGVVED